MHRYCIMAFTCIPKGNTKEVRFMHMGEFMCEHMWQHVKCVKMPVVIFHLLAIVCACVCVCISVSVYS